MNDGIGTVWRFPFAKPTPRGKKTLVMGILNMTPDSFSGKNAAASTAEAVDLARRMLDDGADMIDVGAESSRPGARALTAAEEMSRLGNVVARLRERVDCPLSVDTYHPETAEFAMNQGADIINDITALRGGWSAGDSANARMAETAAKTGAHVVLMHMPCSPMEMAEERVYPDGVVRVVAGFLRERILFAEKMGVKRERLWLDPGFGFGKNFSQNRDLLLDLEQCRLDGLPLLVGLSRKRMVGDALNVGVEARLEGSLALAVIAATRGADAVRTHDVPETTKALAMTDAVVKAMSLREG